jgi:hypothetical protein
LSRHIHFGGETLQNVARQFPVPGKPSCSPIKRTFLPCFPSFVLVYVWYSFLFWADNKVITPVITYFIILSPAKKRVIGVLVQVVYPVCHNKPSLLLRLRPSRVLRSPSLPSLSPRCKHRKNLLTSCFVGSVSHALPDFNPSAL